MRIVVLPEAADEFDDATDYYEQQAGLGQQFRDEVDRHIRSSPPTRRCHASARVVTGVSTLRSFRTTLPISSRSDAVWVLAIAHGHRQPEYWIRRRLKVSQPDA